MIKQNPFSFYDFLGYFIPGAITLLLILVFFNLDNIHDYNSLINVLTKNEEFQIDRFMFFIIISYSMGHLINYLSSFTIEKYTNWRYDYPSKYLLSFSDKNKYFKKNIKTKNKIYRYVLAFLILPVYFCDYLLGDKFEFKSFYTSPVKGILLETIKQKSVVLLNKLRNHKIDNLSDVKDDDFHRILSHYVFENTKNHSSKLSNYVALYGFLRCMCLISVISFWIYVYYLIINIFSYFNTSDAFRLNDISISKVIILLVILCVCYIYFMAFIKFYRRYTLETYMIIAIDKDLVEEV